MKSSPSREARRAASAKALRTAAKSLRSNATGGVSAAVKAIGDGAYVFQPFGWPDGICAPPSHNFCRDPYLPEWLIWIPIGMSDHRRTLCSTRAIEDSESSE